MTVRRLRNVVIRHGLYLTEVRGNTNARRFQFFDLDTNVEFGKPRTP